jgi:hypothetical protein
VRKAPFRITYSYTADRSSRRTFRGDLSKVQDDEGTFLFDNYDDGGQKVGIVRSMLHLLIVENIENGTDRRTDEGSGG